MAMADVAPSEAEEGMAEEGMAEEALVEEALAEVAPEEAMMEEAMMGEAAPEEAMMAEEGGEELSPEEQALLMELLASEGMGGEDIEAYDKMSHAISTGQLNIKTLPGVQQNYFNSCKQACQTAASKLRGLKASARLSTDLNSIYTREAK